MQSDQNRISNRKRLRLRSCLTAHLFHFYIFASAPSEYERDGATNFHFLSSSHQRHNDNELPAFGVISLERVLCKFYVFLSSHEEVDYDKERER